MFDPLSPRRRLLTFALALVLQRVLARISTARISTVRRATQPTSVAPALLPLAAAPRRLAPAGAPAIAASALATVLFLRLPAWAAARSGLVGLGLRAALLALTFDAWAAARTAATIADDLAAGDSVQARHRLQHLTADALPQDMSAQEIADRTAEALAAGAADRTVGPWLAYALFDLPGAVAYHLPVLLTSLWGQIPAVLMRAPVLNRAAGAGPRLALVRAIAARAAGLAYGAAAPAVGADPVPAIRASFAADQPAPAAAAAAINQTAAPAANQAAIDDAAMNQSAAPAAKQAAIDDAAMNQSAAPPPTRRPSTTWP